MLKWGTFFNEMLDHKIFSYLKNKKYLILINSQQQNVQRFYFFTEIKQCLTKTKCYIYWLFITIILTYLELIFHIQRKQVLDFNQQKLETLVEE